jgi:hypothetical protein
MKTIMEMAQEAGMSIHSNWAEQKLEAFAKLVREDEIEACSKTKAGQPRKLKPVGLGAFLDEQQFCFDKGWREGAASVRAAIRARGKQA